MAAPMDGAQHARFKGRYAPFCVRASLEGHAIDCGCQA